MKSIPQTILLLGLVSFFTDISSEMIYPLLPVFLTGVLGASTVALGVIEGIAEATSAFFRIISGMWTDRIQKRKPFILVGYSLAGFVRPLIGLAFSWPMVLGLRFLDRVGKGLRSAPRDALIADVSSHDRRGAAFGFHRAMDHAGAVMGPVVASLLLGVFGFSMREVFFYSLVPAVIAIFILFWAVREPVRQIPSEKSPKFHPLRDWKSLGADFRILLVALLIFTLGNSTDAFFLVRFAEAGLSTQWVVALWSGHSLIKMFSNLYGGRLTDRWGTRPLIFTGWILFSATYFGFSQFESLPSLVVIFLIYGMFYGFVEPAERALISQLVPSHLRGTAFGYFYFITGLGLLPASFLFGWVWQKWSAERAFLIGALLALLACGVLALIGLRGSRKLR